MYHLSLFYFFFMNYSSYEPVIGLETHLQLATQSKAFCSDDASFGGEPDCSWCNFLKNQQQVDSFAEVEIEELDD